MQDGRSCCNSSTWWATLRRGAGGVVLWKARPTSPWWPPPCVGTRRGGCGPDHTILIYPVQSLLGKGASPQVLRSVGSDLRWPPSEPGQRSGLVLSPHTAPAGTAPLAPRRATWVFDIAGRILGDDLKGWKLAARHSRAWPSQLGCYLRSFCPPGPVVLCLRANQPESPEGHTDTAIPFTLRPAETGRWSSRLP